MGKTIPSYRCVLEWEIRGWQRFRKELGSQEDRAAFDELMDMCRNHSMAGGCACKPVLFEPMAMSILLSQTRRLMDIEEQFYVLLARKLGLTVIQRRQGDGLGQL